MGTIALNAFYLLDSVQKGHISLFLAILALRHARVYVCSFNGGNIIPYIEVLVNVTFCLTLTLNISDVQPDNSHIQLWEDLNDIGF